MKSCSRRWFAGLLLAPILVRAEKPSRCEVCGHRLPRQYWTFDGHYACSQVCVDRLRPRCEICKKIIKGEHFTKDGKVYCSQACLDQTLPKCEICHKPIHEGYTFTRHHYCKACVENNPTCFSCGLPAGHPTTLKDGRIICNTCNRWAVKNQEQAQRHYDRAVRHIQAWTSMELGSVPKLELVDRKEMNKLAQDIRKTDSPVSIRGLYSRQVSVTRTKVFGFWRNRETVETEENETIYIIDHLHDQVFRTAAVHELMHDMIFEHFPRLNDAPLWVHEGICQQAAAEYCRRRNYVDTLRGIEECQDPDYGDGFRYIDKLTGFNGWRALKRWMETVDVESLPATAPK